MATSLRQLPGIGPKTEKLFLKMDISSQEELLRTYPRDYDLYEEPCPPEAVVAGQKNAVLARVRQNPTVKRFGKQSITILRLQEGGAALQVNWFHMPYLRQLLRVGEDYVFRGSVIEKNGRKILQHPEVFRPEEYRERCGGLLPIYGLTAGLKNKTIRRAVEGALAEGHFPEESLPESFRREYGLTGIEEAIRQIHFPADKQAFLRARHRLVFEEFFYFQLGVATLKTQLQKEENRVLMPVFARTDALLSKLPYSLTSAQLQVLRELRQDLNGPHLMYRMIQGDVGSGKTILAFAAMAQAYENGWQSVLMAPTEVLANQHYTSLCRFLGKEGTRDAAPVLLTGSLSAKEKKERKEAVASGQARMIIGTHALFQEDVEYAELGLVITDEQHRFGVRQRTALQEKGAAPHVLVMSATPIPRTLARILYGDLAISLVTEMPADRIPIKNAVVDPSYRETAYRFIKKEIDAGHQAFVVCPMIEPNEELSCADVQTVTAALKEKMGDAVHVGMLHGQMRADEKEQIMQAFSDGRCQILVCTTVVEVGIDVPRATVMMIENAERFGLAQLHQLRGRVGRGKDQSYCIFVQGNGKKEREPRLEIIGSSNDGFVLAEEDLKLRGPGDLFGTRQSGLVAFRLADIYRDASILQEAHTAAARVLSEDPALSYPEHAGFRKAVEKLASYAQKEYDN